MAENRIEISQIVNFIKNQLKKFSSLLLLTDVCVCGGVLQKIKK